MLTTDQQNTTTASGKQTTPFGAVEDPQMMLSLPQKGVVAFDTLACLKNLWGANILMSRKHIYELVSGTVSDAIFRELIASYYKRYAAFANYVDEKYIFEDQSVPLVVRVIKPIRAVIEEYTNNVLAVCKQSGGKYIGTNCDYVYFVFPNDYVPNFEECVRL